MAPKVVLERYGHETAAFAVHAYLIADVVVLVFNVQRFERNVRAINSTNNSKCNRTQVPTAGNLSHMSNLW